MASRTIDQFFRTLSGEFKESAAILVTGASAASLWGPLPNSQELDFEIRLSGNHSSAWERFRSAINRTTQQTGIQANYAETIDRWSGLALLNRRRPALHRKFSTLSVRLLEPVYWSIGKLGRYFEADVADVVDVFTRTRVSAPAALRVWGIALKESQSSGALPQFQGQVETFLRAHGRAIWGKTFDPDAAIARFQRCAGVAPLPVKVSRSAVAVKPSAKSPLRLPEHV